MFGATALRRKREKERRERAAKSGANRIYPYIKPFGKNTFYEDQHPSNVSKSQIIVIADSVDNRILPGPCFDRNELPYFKHRTNISQQQVRCQTN